MQTLVRSFFRTCAFALPLQGACQYCIPTTAIPYDADMPGLTLVQVNTLMRTSQDIENYPNNSYVNTGAGTTVARGETYPITLSFTLDALIAPHMNLRIWVDLNQDGQLDDPGETLYSVDHVSTTQISTITIPATALTGTTRMRVTAKMCSHGGHSLPTPCDMPPDILGYHGEIEDYYLTITDGVGIQETTAPLWNASLSPNPSTGVARLSYALNQAGPVTVDLLDLAGRMVSHLFAAVQQSPGEHQLPLDLDPAAVPDGLYLLQISARGQVTMLKLAVER